jgi:hypothetical protein
MTQTHEERFLAFIKGAENLETNIDSTAGTTPSPEVYADPEDAPTQRTEAVEFSDVAQEGSRDVRQGVMSRVLDNVSRTQEVGRALVSAMVGENYETTALSLRPAEKISHPTLSEMVVGRCGRL